MEVLIELFMKYGGLSVWLFIIAVPPQIWNNFKNKKYTSGTIWTWVIFVVGSVLFGLYMFVKGEYIAAIGQATGFVFSGTIIIQSFVYEKANDK